MVNGYSDGHVDCCKPQSSLIDGVIGREIVWVAWQCKRASKILGAGVYLIQSAIKARVP